VKFPVYATCEAPNSTSQDELSRSVDVCLITVRAPASSGWGRPTPAVGDNPIAGFNSCGGGRGGTTCG
jgi:hypothetical protein